MVENIHTQELNSSDDCWEGSTIQKEVHKSWTGGSTMLVKQTLDVRGKIGGILQGVLGKTCPGPGL